MISFVVVELIALDWDYLDSDTDSPELFPSGGFQKDAKRDAHFDLVDETARQLRRSEQYVENARSSVPESPVWLHK